MILIIAIAVVAVVLGGFLLLTAFEMRSGSRFLAPLRARLDVYIGGFAHGLRRMNMSSFAYTKVRRTLIHVVHECTHGILVTVRALERLLTHAVKTIRHHKDGGDREAKVR